MKAYIQSYKNGIPHNYNFMNAYQGFDEMGIEVIPFHDKETLQGSNREDVVVGYVGTVRSRCQSGADAEITGKDRETIAGMAGVRTWIANAV